MSFQRVFRLTGFDGDNRAAPCGGSNWLTVERMRQDYVGLKSDGSLWVSEKPGSGIWNANEDEMGQLVRFENETHWSSLAPAGYSATASYVFGTGAFLLAGSEVDRLAR